MRAYLDEEARCDEERQRGPAVEARRLGSAESCAEGLEVAFEELLPTFEEYEPIFEVEDEASDVQQHSARMIRRRMMPPLR